jgi:hypothetical protein
VKEKDMYLEDVGENFTSLELCSELRIMCHHLSLPVLSLRILYTFVMA